MVKPNATIQHVGNGFYHVIVNGKALLVRTDNHDELIKDIEKDMAYYSKKAKAIGKKHERT